MVTVIEVLKHELDFRKGLVSDRVLFTWTDKCGNEHLSTKMSDSYIKNVIKFLQRTGNFELIDGLTCTVKYHPIVIKHAPLFDSELETDIFMRQDWQD